MSAGLSVLPPSPPTTTSRRHVSNLDVTTKPAASSQMIACQRPSNIALGTPDESPASYPGSSGSGSGRKRKRVEFSPWTNMQDPPAFTTSSPDRNIIRPLPPSRECLSSASILKVSARPDRINVCFDSEPKPQLDVSEMLESILQQLSNEDTVSSLDAYQTLSSSLKACDDVPDALAFKAKMSSLIQYIRRDLTVLDKAKYQAGDVNLLTQALKVLAILVWDANLAALLNADFQSFVVEHAIRALEQHNTRVSEDAGNGKTIQEQRVPKIVILHYLHLLATQNFRQSVIVGGYRVPRLLAALRELTNRFTGSGVVSQRLLVYQKLVDQVKSTMQANTKHWVDELVEALVATNNDVRSKAISLGSKVMIAMPSSALSESVAETLNDPAGDEAGTDKSRSWQMCRRLEKMLSVPEESNQVPQIWSVVLSLRKSGKDGIEAWTGLKDWIRIIQKCFNSSIPAVRSQANLAWARFIRVVNPTEASDSLLSMLTKPITAQLERKDDRKHSKSYRAIAFSTYCSLLYYAFRPGASHKQYDRMWNETIVKVIKSSFLDANSVNPDRASRILISLLWNGNAESKIWREGRAQESGLIEPEELPTIDCRWIRSRTKSILQLFKLLFRLGSWGTADDPSKAFVAIAWQHFSNALGDASCKEVISSPDLVNAVSEITDFLEELWKNGPLALNDTYESQKNAYIARYRYICMTILFEVGAIAMTEGSFHHARRSDHPSHDQSGQTASVLPIIRILMALTAEPAPVNASQSYVDLLKDILGFVGKARSSSLSRIHLYKQMTQSACFVHENSARPFEATLFWQPLAELVLPALKDPNLVDPIKTNLDQHDLVEDIIYLLQQGLPQGSNSHELWHKLFQEMSRLIKSPTQKFELTIWPVIERLSEFLHNKTVPHPSPYSGYLVRSFLEQITEISTDDDHPRFKVRGSWEREPPPFFMRILDILSLDLQLWYWDESAHEESALSGIIDATCQTLLCWPTAKLMECFTILKFPIMEWLEDSARLQTSATRVGALKLVSAQRLCPLVIGKLGAVSSSTEITEDLGDILAAGFRSTHKMTINAMIVMWNTTYGTRKHQNYPADLREAIEHLRPFVGIETPGLATQSGSDTQKRPNSFPIPSGDADDLLRVDSNGEADYPANINEVSSPPNIVQADGPPAVADQLPPAQHQTPLKLVKNAKLRHDDSQIEFVPIESSPLATFEMDSQIMTDRQKEIRDRQRTELAVVFSDLRSSPRSMRDTRVLQSADVDAEEMVQDAPSTPILAPQIEAFMNEMTTSSPTPQPKQPALDLDEKEIPSSPPSIPGLDAEQSQTPGPQEVDQSVGGGVGPSQNGLQADEYARMDDFCTLDGTVSESTKVIVLEESREILLPREVDQNSLPDTVIDADGTKAPLFAPSEGQAVNRSSTEHFTSVSARPETKNDFNSETSMNFETTEEFLFSDTKTPERAREHPHIEPEGDHIYNAAGIAMTSSPNSDEIEKLSASQLSQDLDWHIAEQARLSPTAMSPPPETAIATVGGKRKASVDSVRSNRKRKAPRSEAASPQGPMSDESPPRDDAELLDCIVVDTTPRTDRIRAGPSAPSRASPEPAPDPARKKPHGRPSTRLRDETALARSSPADPVPAGTMSDATGPDVGASPTADQAAPVTTPDAPATSQLGDLPHPAPVARHETAVPPDEREAPTPDACRPPGTELVAALHHILCRLGETAPGIDMPTLRVVDDLLFAIRVGVQERRGGGGGAGSG